MGEPLEDLRPWRKGTKSDWRNWRKQAVNKALVGVVLLILGPFLLLVGGGQLGGFLTLVGFIAVMSGIVYYVSYTRKLERLSGGGGQR